MEKAKLVLTGEGAPTTIPVLFNPEQYNISRSVNYAQVFVPGLDNPILQFISGKQTTLNLTLFFDTQNDYIPSGTQQDVRKLTVPIMRALQIDGKIHSPPTAAFNWGSFSFKGVITDAKQSFTMFLPNGKPVRSKMDITFVYAGDPSDKKSSPFESPDRTKVRVLEQDGALWRLAYTEYGDASLWRFIADANKIYNPLRCKAGQMLKIPPLPDGGTI